MQKPLLAIVVVGTLCVAGGGVRPAGAERTVVDRVVAVVEDHAIFQSDVEQTIKQFLLQRGMPELSESELADLEKQALDELINSRLVLAKANRLGVEASFGEVEKMVENALEDNKKVLGGQAAFDRQLKAEGLTLDELKQLYREQIRNRLLVDRVLAREIDRGSLRITDDDLRAAFDNRKDSMIRPGVVHLRTIFFALGASEAAQAAARARIEEAHRRVLAGEDFAKLARNFSEDPSAEHGGNLGPVNLADLRDRKFAEAAAGLRVGEVSGPVLTSYGYHLIQVTGVDSVRQEVELRHILVRTTPGDQDVQETFRRATRIHKQLLAGARFDSTAVKFSDDQATASSGGDLGWLRVNDLPEFFRDVLQGMKPGDISPVLREPSGFRIVQLVEKEEARPYRFEEVRDELRKVVEQEKMGNVYKSYLAALRKEFYVDVRGDGSNAN